MSAAIDEAIPAEPGLDDPLMPLLHQICVLLDDGTDHPEVWETLADLDPDLRSALQGLIDAIHGFQHQPSLLKSFALLAAFLTALERDTPDAIVPLQRLEAANGLSPQVAGALFFIERHGDPAGETSLTHRFCDAPFVKFETLIDGQVAPCCSIWTQHRLGSLDGQSFEEIWNGEGAQTMRESILDGSFRYCNKQRCTFIREDALPLRDAVSDPGLRRIIDGGLIRLETRPNWLFLAHDLTCNLSCPSCRSELLGATEEQERRFDRIENDVFRPLLDAGDPMTLSLSGQGDPWSSHHYRSLLRYLADHDLPVDLRLHTNALLMSEAKWQDYRGLEKYNPVVDVSIDACSPEVYDVVRRPGKWSKLLPNLHFIAAKRTAGVFRAFHINATVQLDNYHELPALVAFADAIGADTVRMYMMQNTGEHIGALYARMNVGEPSHPLHMAFLETLRHPLLGSPRAHLYDVAFWRDRALRQRLPSDALGAMFDYDALLDAIDDALASDKMAEIVALCAAGSVRFGHDNTLLNIEARALQRLGFAQQAGYRLSAVTDALQAA